MNRSTSCQPQLSIEIIGARLLSRIAWGRSRRRFDPCLRPGGRQLAPPDGQYYDGRGWRAPTASAVGSRSRADRIGLLDANGGAQVRCARSPASRRTGGSRQPQGAAARSAGFRQLPGRPRADVATTSSGDRCDRIPPDTLHDGRLFQDIQESSLCGQPGCGIFIYLILASSSAGPAAMAT